MTYRGHVKNGRITLDDSATLPEGAELRIEVVEKGTPAHSVSDDLRGIVGSVDGPEDWAENHDHYIHGTPKRT